MVLLIAHVHRPLEHAGPGRHRHTAEHHPLRVAFSVCVDNGDQATEAHVSLPPSCAALGLSGASAWLCRRPHKDVRQNRAHLLDLFRVDGKQRGPGGSNGHTAQR